jgi:hypothetical protein
MTQESSVLAQHWCRQDTPLDRCSGDTGAAKHAIEDSCLRELDGHDMMKGHDVGRHDEHRIFGGSGERGGGGRKFAHRTIRALVVIPC